MSPGHRGRPSTPRVDGAASSRRPSVLEAGRPSAAARTGRELEGLPLYRQVSAHLERLALSQPFDDVSPLPPEAELGARLGVSRGTLRRATDDLARDGLLRIEPGRGTFVDKATQVRWWGWDRLAEVARPDSRFHLDVSRFIPDFVGREECDRLVTGLAAYKEANVVFAAPDNSLQSFRERALLDGKQLIVPTFGLRRGMVSLDASVVPVGLEALAATLDGMERFALPLNLEGIRQIGKVDLVVTGAVAVTEQGVHVDAGTGMFGLEWALLAHLGVAGGQTLVVATVHSCQVISALLEPAPTGAVIDLIATPDGLQRCDTFEKSDGSQLNLFPPDLLGTVPYLNDLAARASQPARPVRWRR